MREPTSFGYSDAPSPADFSYTFDRLATVADRFTQLLGLERYVLFMQDYGGPSVFVLALAHPERVRAMIVQIAVAHEAGFGPLWETRKACISPRAVSPQHGSG